MICGVVIALIVVTAAAPAALLNRLLRQVEVVELQDLSGTVWVGSALAVVNEKTAGTLRWSFRPSSVLDGCIGFNWTLTDYGYDLEGVLELAFSQVRVLMNGGFEPHHINALIAPYNMSISGNFVISNVKVEYAARSRQLVVDGNVEWLEGKATYQMGQRLNTTPVMSLAGSLFMADQEPTLVATFAGQETTLLRASLDMEDGWARIGVTNELMRAIGHPWPTSATDDTIVLEVAERVFF